MSTDEQSPPYLQTILEGCLSGYAPADAADDADACRVVSSQEILLDLADMADISLNDLAVTARLGYTAVRRDGKVGWLIKATALSFKLKKET